MSAFFDTGGFPAADISGDGGVGAQYYQFTVTETSSYTITLNWPAGNAADLDLVLCNDPGCSESPDGLFPSFVAAGASHPEGGDYNNLAPGTYYIVAVFFEASTVPPAPPDFPTRIDITIERRS
jgi:hypothetical protein